MRYPSAHTRLVVLLGNPLGHTKSPAMHNRVFEKSGLDYLYIPVEVGDENLEVVFRGLKRMNVAGFNVTIPHKVRIMELLDSIDPLAQVIGAVNTICVQEGRTIGCNTDGKGFLMSLEQELGDSAPPERVTIIGSGGAARAIAVTLASRGASKVYLVNRTVSKAQALAAEINSKIAPCAEVVLPRPADMACAIRDSQVLVNATSLGMTPQQGGLPLDPALLFKDLVVADIVYNPLMTRLLKAAQQTGCRTVSGRGMLVYQGALSFNLWTGLEPLTEEMFAAFDEASDQNSD